MNRFLAASWAVCAIQWVFLSQRHIGESTAVFLTYNSLAVLCAWAAIHNASKGDN